MFDGRRFTSQTIVQHFRDFFKWKHNLTNPETKIDYVQEGGELRNIIEALTPPLLTSLDYINKDYMSKYIFYSEGEVLDLLADQDERRPATYANGCVIWKYEIPNLKQIQNKFKTYTTLEVTSEDVFNHPNIHYENRRLPVPFYSYNNNFDEVNNNYEYGNVPIAGDFAIMQEIIMYRTKKDKYPLYKQIINGETRYYFSEDIYLETESIDPVTGLPTTTATIIYYMNDFYDGEVLREYGDYFVVVWNKNTLAWNRMDFPQGFIVNEGTIITTDPKDADSEELEFAIILSEPVVENFENINLNIECEGKGGYSSKNSFLTLCGVENTLDILLNYNIPSCNWTMRLPVESVGRGTEYNIKKKTLVNFDSSQFTYSDISFEYLSVYNPSDFINAKDPEDDDSFKERIASRRQKCGFGTVQWYESTTMNMEGVEDVKIINRPKGDWTATIIVKPNDPEVIKTVSCYFSNMCNNLMGINIGVEGVQYHVLDKILIPYMVNPENANVDMSIEELEQDTENKIYNYFKTYKIGQTLSIRDISDKIDTLPGIALLLDDINGFYYYDEGEDIMKNAKEILVCPNCAIYIEANNIYFTMTEFNPKFEEGRA